MIKRIISLRLDETCIKKLDKYAKKEGRTRSNYIHYILNNKLKRLK